MWVKSFGRMPVKLLLIVEEEGYLENTLRLSLHIRANQYRAVKIEWNRLNSKKLKTGSCGKIRAHSSLMYLNLCSEALRTDNGEQTERKKNGKGKGRIWKEKREDERAAYWGIGVYCEWLMSRQGCWVRSPSNKNGLIHPFHSLRIIAP